MSAVLIGALVFDLLMFAVLASLSAMKWIDRAPR